LKQYLIGQFPGIRPQLNKVLVSINQEIALEEDALPSGAEVAFLPPVSGGGGLPTITKIVEEPLDQNRLLEQITLESTGAACTFTGIVRGKTRCGREYSTTALEYEAYKPMAEAKMAQIADEIRQRWPEIEGIGIAQRIGYLEAGTVTVLVACTASHRDTGVFEAARYGIDRIKEVVPVWKKEIGPEGEEWVEGELNPRSAG